MLASRRPVTGDSDSDAPASEMLNGDNLHHIVKVGGLKVFGKMRQTNKTINGTCHNFGKQFLSDILAEINVECEVTARNSNHSIECDHGTQIAGCTSGSDEDYGRYRRARDTGTIDQDLSFADIVKLVKFKLRTLQLRKLDHIQKQLLEATAIFDDARYQLVCRPTISARKRSQAQLCPAPL